MRKSIVSFISEIINVVSVASRGRRAEVSQCRVLIFSISPFTQGLKSALSVYYPQSYMGFSDIYSS